jgi:hypothetical protein
MHRHGKGRVVEGSHGLFYADFAASQPWFGAGGDVAWSATRLAKHCNRQKNSCCACYEATSHMNETCAAVPRPHSSDTIRGYHVQANGHRYHPHGRPGALGRLELRARGLRVSRVTSVPELLRAAPVRDPQGKQLPSGPERLPPLPPCLPASAGPAQLAAAPAAAGRQQRQPRRRRRPGCRRPRIRPPRFLRTRSPVSVCL